MRVSVVHRVAQESYRRKEWDLALAYAARAEAMDESRADLRSIQFKALVQLEHYAEAEAMLQRIIRHGDRFAYYLRGFMLRKQRKYAEATKAFESALDTGDRSISVYRDYAESLYRCHRYEDAMRVINRILTNESENVYLLDLVIRVNLDSGNVGSAEKYLTQLERYDLDKRFINHRRAAFFAKRHAWDLALIASDEACQSPYSPFEAFAQKVDILIEMDRFDEAAVALESLETRFRNSRIDVQLGVRCKLLIRQGRWAEAHVVWGKLQSKDLPVHKSLLSSILELKSKDVSVARVERERAKLELNLLSRSLQDRRLPALDFSESYE